MATEIHVNDIGTTLECTIKDNGVIVDLSSATSLRVILKSPDNRKLNKQAVITNPPGTDGKMEYVTIDGDLESDGDWELQGIVEIGGRWHTDTKIFTVAKNL